jgi:hypothetical protein
MVLQYLYVPGFARRQGGPPFMVGKLDLPPRTFRPASRPKRDSHRKGRIRHCLLNIAKPSWWGSTNLRFLMASCVPPKAGQPQKKADIPWLINYCKTIMVGKHVTSSGVPTKYLALDTKCQIKAIPTCLARQSFSLAHGDVRQPPNGDLLRKKTRGNRKTA